jgi:hypothetical protein
MIQPIVEGQGEEQAVPVLLRRLIPELGCFVSIGKPIRQRRTEIVREGDFKRALQLAQLKPGILAILVLFDADDDCARNLIPKMRDWAAEAAPNVPCAIVMARREYEAWFLAALESLRGQRGISEDAYYSQEPEQKRGAKDSLSEFMPRNTLYSPSADQAALSAVFALEHAYRRAASFQKLVKELCRILGQLDQQPFIPQSWNENL